MGSVVGAGAASVRGCSLQVPSGRDCGICCNADGAISSAGNESARPCLLESGKQDDVLCRNLFEGKTGLFPRAQTTFDDRCAEAMLVQNARDIQAGGFPLTRAIED